MEPVEFELQWWAFGLYDEVVRQRARRGKPISPKTARHIVAKQLKAHYRATGDPLWRPIGDRQRDRLRRRIRENRALDHELQ